MTRPLGKQINDPRTKHTRLAFTVVPGSSSLTIPAGTLNPLTITGIPGGSEEDVHPQVLGSAVEPFATSAGDQISIQIDNTPIVLITFGSTDTSASAVATRINTVYGSTIAYVINGRLYLRSNGVIGYDGTMNIQDTVGAPLSKFGLVAGIIHGVDNSTRGILTTTEDGLGGYASIRLPGAQNLVTDANEFIRSSGFNNNIIYNLGIPGGQPIHGRLSYNGTSYILSFFSYLPNKASVTTKSSDFAALDVTDSITFTVTYNDSTVPCVVTFPSPPYTRDGVIDRINTVWANNTYSTSGSAYIKSVVSQPYDFTGETIYVSVNNAAETAVTFDSLDRTIQDVVTKLLAVPGLSAATFVEANGIYLTLQTLTGVGFNSTISIRDNDAAGHNALAKLGIIAGVYKGPYIAKPSGIGEIEITSHNRGSKSSLLVAGGAQTLGRMGLTGVTGGVASDVEVDIPVNLPDLVSFGRTKGNYLVEFLIPEVVSFGEIPTDNASNKEEFDNFSTGSNVDLKRDAAIFPSTQSYPDTFRNRGQNAGKVVSVGPDGLIDIGQLGHATNHADRFFKQFIGGNFSTGKVDALIASEIQSPGYNGNPLFQSPTISARIDRNDTYNSTQRSFNIIFGPSTTNPGYQFRESYGTVRRGMTFGEGLSAGESFAIPRITYSVPTINLNLIDQTQWGTSDKLRNYVSFGFFGNADLYRTINAAFDGTSAYNRDSTVNTSVRTVDGSAIGFFRDVYSGANATVPGWTTRFFFPNTPSIGNENEFRDMLRLGEALLGSAIDANKPRLIADSSTQTRTQIFESDNTYGGPAIRAYAVRNAVHLSNSAANCDGYEITRNAKWRNDLSPQVWEIDNTDTQAVKLFIGDGGFHVKTTGGSPPSTFLDTDTTNGWRSGDSGGGGSSSSFGIPATAFKWRSNVSGQEEVICEMPGPFVFDNNKFDSVAYRANSLHINLIPKMLGRIYNSAGVITQSAGYGVSGVTTGASSIVVPYPVTPDDYTEVVVNATITGPATTSARVIPTPGAFSITFFIINTTTAVALPLASSSFGLDFSVSYVAS